MSLRLPLNRARLAVAPLQVLMDKVLAAQCVERLAWLQCTKSEEKTVGLGILTQVVQCLHKTEVT